MRFDELTNIWCFGEGSVWWRLSLITQLDCLVDGIDTQVEVRDGINARAQRNATGTRVIFQDGAAPTLIDIYQRMLWAARVKRTSGTFLGMPVTEAADRDALALRLAKLTIDFIVLHELSHIARRHLETPFPGLPFDELAEFGGATGSSSKLDAFQHRLLEADADISALGLMAMLIPSMAQQTHRYRFPSSRVAERVLRFAIFTFFNLASRGKPLEVSEFEKDTLTTHPHPAIRARLIRAYAPRLIDSRWPVAGRWMSTWNSWAMLRRSSNLLRKAGYDTPLYSQSAKQVGYVVYRSQALLEERNRLWPTWVKNSRWEEVLRRLDAVA